jgi:integrase-like protein
MGPPRLRPRTLAGYKQIINSHLKPNLGGIPIKDLAGLVEPDAFNASPPIAKAAGAVLSASIATSDVRNSRSFQFARGRPVRSRGSVVQATEETTEAPTGRESV